MCRGSIRLRLTYRVFDESPVKPLDLYGFQVDRYRSLFTTHYSRLTTHYSLQALTTHYSLPTSHYSLLTTPYSLRTASRWSCLRSPLSEPCAELLARMEACGFLSGMHSSDRRDATSRFLRRCPILISETYLPTAHPLPRVGVGSLVVSSQQSIVGGQ